MTKARVCFPVDVQWDGRITQEELLDLASRQFEVSTIIPFVQDVEGDGLVLNGGEATISLDIVVGWPAGYVPTLAEIFGWAEDALDAGDRNNMRVTECTNPTLVGKTFADA
jgi:hypothetical protein